MSTPDWVTLSRPRKEKAKRVHVDANLKLSHLGIAVTACVDGCSRYVLYMKPLLSLGAIDVLRPFHVACTSHGVPDVLAIDRGNENCLVLIIQHVQHNVACSKPSLSLSLSLSRTSEGRGFLFLRLVFLLLFLEGLARICTVLYYHMLFYITNERDIIV